MGAVQTCIAFPFSNCCIDGAVSPEMRKQSIKLRTIRALTVRNSRDMQTSAPVLVLVHELIDLVHHDINRKKLFLNYEKSLHHVKNVFQLLK